MSTINPIQMDINPVPTEVDMNPVPTGEEIPSVRAEESVDKEDPLESSNPHNNIEGISHESSPSEDISTPPLDLPPESRY